MANTSPEAIAKWAENTSRLHKGQGSTLRTEQVATILQLHKLHKTQAEIAQAIGCDQGTVSRWLSRLTDTTELASSYLRGSALRMARNVVQKGQARDHIQALKGVGVLEADRTEVNLAIGVSLPGLTFASPVVTVSSPQEPLSGDLGSDN
jgi:hypothetical protein